MRLPPDSPGARIAWSIPAAVIVAVWALAALGEGVTIFPRHYTLVELLGEIARQPGRAITPAVYAPVLAAVCWPLCLVPWRMRSSRAVAMVFALLVPAGLVLLVSPMALVVGPLILVMGARAMLMASTGEMYDDGWVPLGAAGTWWWFMVPIIIMTARRRLPKRDECPICGYSTIGLVGPTCPECGEAIRAIPPLEVIIKTAPDGSLRS